MYAVMVASTFLTLVALLGLTVLKSGSFSLGWFLKMRYQRLSSEQKLSFRK